MCRCWVLGDREARRDRGQDRRVPDRFLSLQLPCVTEYVRWPTGELVEAAKDRIRAKVEHPSARSNSSSAFRSPGYGYGQEPLQDLYLGRRDQTVLGPPLTAADKMNI